MWGKHEYFWRKSWASYKTGWICCWVGLQTNVCGESPLGPRYLKYEPVATNISTFNKIRGPDCLLPDGLHVDTNNGYHLRRYHTIFVYLNCTQELDAANFRLAKLNTAACQNHRHKEEMLLDASKKLLRANNVQHTEAAYY